MTSERDRLLLVHFRDDVVRPPRDRGGWRLRDRLLGVPDPRRAGGYITDPNYYRLAYHLAAQQVNATMMGGELDATRIPEPGHICRRLLAEADWVVAWHEARCRRRVWRLGLRRKLSPEAQRLDRFLRDTIRPTVRLLLAGTLLSRNPREADRVAAPVREQPRKALGYRTLYNLACFELALAARQPHGREQAAEDALSLLAAAFRKASARGRPELAAWAAKDPSFRSLRASKVHGPRLRALIAEYGPVDRRNGNRAPRRSRRRVGRARSE